MTVTAATCIADAIIRLCNKIMKVPDGRHETVRNLQFFLDMIAQGETKKELLSYGKISNLVSLVGLACTPFLNETSEDKTVVQIEPEEWDKFCQGLYSCRRTLLRNDATTLQLPILQKPFDKEGDGDVLSKGKEDNTINEELAANMIFNTDFHDTVMLCLVQQAISIISPYLYGNQALSQETVESALRFIHEKFNGRNTYCSHDLLSLFEMDENGLAIPELKSLDEVRNILQERKDLSLARCIKKCQRLVHSWYLAFCDQLAMDRKSSDVSAIMSLSMPPDLKGEHYKLPNATPTPRSKRDKKRSHEGAFSGKTDMTTPTTRKSKKFRPKIQSPDFTGIVVDLPRSTPIAVGEMMIPMRRAWTDEETQCVMIGVEKFGKGQWKKIKDAFPKVLRHRSNVQIKDRWRTIEMLKKKNNEE